MCRNPEAEGLAAIDDQPGPSLLAAIESGSYPLRVVDSRLLADHSGCEPAHDWSHALARRTPTSSDPRASWTCREPSSGPRHRPLADARPICPTLPCSGNTNPTLASRAGQGLKQRRRESRSVAKAAVSKRASPAGELDSAPAGQPSHGAGKPAVQKAGGSAQRAQWRTSAGWRSEAGGARGARAAWRARKLRQPVRRPRLNSLKDKFIEERSDLEKQEMSKCPP